MTDLRPAHTLMVLDPAALGPGPDVTCGWHEVPWRGPWGSCGPPSGGAVWRYPGWVIDMATTRSHLTTSPVRGRFHARPLVVFFAVAFAISWAWAIPLALGDQVVLRGQGWPTHYPALLGPAIAAVTVTAMTAGRTGLGDLAARMGRWRVGLRWWLVAVSPAGFLLLALAGMSLTGQDLPQVGDFGRFSGTPTLGLVGVFLAITLVGSLGEETGWRGYALPQLQRRFTH